MLENETTTINEEAKQVDKESAKEEQSTQSTEPVTPINTPTPAKEDKKEEAQPEAKPEELASPKLLLTDFENKSSADNEPEESEEEQESIQDLRGALSPLVATNTNVPVRKKPRKSVS